MRPRPSKFCAYVGARRQQPHKDGKINKSRKNRLWRYIHLYTTDVPGLFRDKNFLSWVVRLFFFSGGEGEGLDEAKQTLASYLGLAVLF